MARMWDTATGKPVGKSIFVPHACTITRRVTKKEPDIYDIEVVPLPLCVTAEGERC